MVLMLFLSSALAQVVLSSRFLRLEISRVGCYFLQKAAFLVLCMLGEKEFLSWIYPDVECPVQSPSFGELW